VGASTPESLGWKNIICRILKVWFAIARQLGSTPDRVDNRIRTYHEWHQIGISKQRGAGANAGPSSQGRRYCATLLFHRNARRSKINDPVVINEVVAVAKYSATIARSVSLGVASQLRFSDPDGRLWSGGIDADTVLGGD